MDGWQQPQWGACRCRMNMYFSDSSTAGGVPPTRWRARSCCRFSVPRMARVFRPRGVWYPAIASCTWEGNTACLSLYSLGSFL